MITTSCFLLASCSWPLPRYDADLAENEGGEVLQELGASIASGVMEVVLLLLILFLQLLQASRETVMAELFQEETEEGAGGQEGQGEQGGQYSQQVGSTIIRTVNMRK